MEALQKSNKLPKDIPVIPIENIRNFQYGLIGDYRTGNLKYDDIERRTYLEAQQWAVNQRIKSQKEWRLAVRSPNFPSDIYKSPDRGYKEFTTWPEFLQSSHGLIPEIKRKDFIKIQKNGYRSVPVISKTHWDFLAKQNLIPLDIPTNLHKVYKEFTGWSDFLGNKIKGKASLKEISFSLGAFTFFISQNSRENRF